MARIAKKIEELTSIESILDELTRICNISLDDEAELLKGICNKLSLYYGPVFILSNGNSWVPLQIDSLSSEIKRHKYWINAFGNFTEGTKYRIYNANDFPDLYIVRHYQMENLQLKQFPKVSRFDEELNVNIEGLTPKWFNPNAVAE